MLQVFAHKAIETEEWPLPTTGIRGAKQIVFLLFRHRKDKRISHLNLIQTQIPILRHKRRVFAHIDARILQHLQQRVMGTHFFTV